MNVRSLLAIALALTGACAADTTLDDVDGVGTEALMAAGEEAATPDLEPLAVLAIGEGHEIFFALDPESDEVSVSESAPVDTDEMPVLWQETLRDLEPLELYLELTPDDRPVPGALVDLATDRETLDRVEPRALVESLEVAPARPNLPKVNTSQDSASMQSLCGSNGESAFQSICNTSGSGMSLSYCVPYKHGWHQRTTNGKYRESRGFTVACSASVQTRHERRIGGIWYDKTFHSNASGYWHYTRVWNNSLKYRRRVRMDRYLPTSPNTSVSYIRSWIGIKN
ncbi:MAG: hypothetical protein JJ863_11485 [Deltaproteobacteria bacterium]|nr:hypothetical protein [Deltaproteobacteria bacterium]